jgi:hypothetical protein
LSAAPRNSRQIHGKGRILLDITTKRQLTLSKYLKLCTKHAKGFTWMASTTWSSPFTFQRWEMEAQQGQVIQLQVATHTSVWTSVFYKMEAMILLMHSKRNNRDQSNSANSTVPHPQADVRAAVNHYCFLIQIPTSHHLTCPQKMCRLLVPHLPLAPGAGNLELEYIPWKMGRKSSNSRADSATLSGLGHVPSSCGPSFLLCTHRIIFIV